MSKPIRIFTAVLLLIALLIAGAAAWVLLFLDPNDYRPQIADYARRQGVTVDIRGDLAWQLLPRIGIRIGSTSVRSDDGRLPEIDFESAALSMAWLPLLRGEPRIEALSLTGAQIRIANQAQATAAAAAPVAAAPPAETSAADARRGVAIAVRAVDIRDTRVILADPAGDRVLEQLQFSGRDMVLDGSPFPIELEFTYRDPGMPLPMAVALTAALGVDQQKLLIEAQDAKLTLTPEQRPAIAASFGLHFDGERDALDIAALELRSANLVARGEIQVSGLTGDPQATGRLELPAADPRPLLRAWQVPLPEFAAAEALERIGLRSGFRASPQDLQLSDLQLEVDDTRVTGTLSTRLAAPRQLTASLHGDRLDLGRYRTADAKPASPSPATALLAPLAGPLAFLQGGTGELVLDWDELTLDQLRFAALRLRVRFAGDDIRIEELSTRTLGGSATLRGRLDGVTGADPRLSFEPRVEDIMLAQVRQALVSELALDGTLDLTMTGSARGADPNRLQQSLSAQGSFQITDPILTRTNIEGTFCDLVATVERTPKRDDWPDHTRFETIAGSFRLAGPRVTLENLTTGIGNLRLRASGTLDRAAQSYEVLAITRLDGDRTSASGCPVRSARLRNRDIPLRCAGSLGAQSRMACAPDPQFVAGLVGDRALEELRERGKLEGERGKAVEGLLKGLLKQNRDGD